MGYSYLLALEAPLANFRTAYGVLEDVDILLSQGRYYPPKVRWFKCSLFPFDGHSRGWG